VSSAPFNDFIGHPEFHTGFALGVGLTVVGIAAGLVASKRRGGALPIGGLLIAIGFLAGVRRAPHLPSAVGAGLLLLAVAGAVAGRLARRWPASALAGVALAAPGAIVLASHTRVLPTEAASLHAAWIPPLIVASIVVGGPLAADFDRRFGARGWPMPLFAVTVVGVFFTVPDTERALVLLGVSLPLAILGWPIVFASLGSAGAYAAVGTVVWVGATEGRGRHSAIVGAIACLGLFVVEPAARLARGRHATFLEGLPTSTRMLFPVAGLHLALVYIASRVAGVRRSLAVTVAIVTAELIVGVIALALGHVLRREHSSP
jgi:hypothetical protein